MSNNVKMDAMFIKHPTQEGVFLKHFFCKEDNDRLNNLEVNIVPGFQIAPHAHEDSSEFFYVVSGQGEFMDDTEAKPIKKGDAFKAPQGMTHSIKNTGNETLVLFSTFSPATR
ncbi:MAG: cupin domain-containing protein [Syntrophobacterales bacterium]|jgi:mannose-6-phosphate isomerase-like protein (cupin superfamily)|nr:cupin domain-containing protein [Syntrophobacterales bacterium]